MPPEWHWSEPQVASSPIWPASRGLPDRIPRWRPVPPRMPRSSKSCAPPDDPRTTEMPPDPNGLAVRVIPCLDVDGGRVVKGVNFENLRDAGDPVELAAAYDAEG